MARAELGDLGKIIERLEACGRLIRVKSEVDPVHDLAGVAAKLEGRGAAVLFERVKGYDAPVFTGPVLVARTAGRPVGAARARAAGLRLQLHQRVAAEAHAAGRGRRRSRARGDRKPGRPRAAADSDPCAPGRRPLLRRRRGDRQGPGHRRAQRLDPALHGGREQPHARQHRCRAPSRDLPREGGAGRGRRCRSPQRRRRAGPALRRRDARRSGADRHRRARHREHLPRRAAASWCAAPSPTSRWSRTRCTRWNAR